MRITLLCNTIACEYAFEADSHRFAASLTNTCVRFIGIVILRRASTNYVVALRFICPESNFLIIKVTSSLYCSAFQEMCMILKLRETEGRRHSRQACIWGNSIVVSLPLKHLCAFHRNCYFAAHFNHSAVLWNVVKGCLVAVLLHADMQVLCSFAPHLLLSIHMCKHSEFHRFQS